MPERSRPSIEMTRDEYRPVFTGPLANPKHLGWSLLVFGVATIGAAWLSWFVGTWWSAFFPIPLAILFGIGVAGMWPGSWFNIEK